MLFNSYEFIFLLLPASVLGYFLLNRAEKYEYAKAYLILISLFFYGYNEWKYLAIIIFSILLNYSACRLMIRYEQKKKIILSISIFMNLLILGYFKYTDFLIENINLFFHGKIGYLELALPLGISFFTFQQISYLIDTSKGQYCQHSFLDYALFVTFFPQLVAGPIVSHDEMLPQFASKDNRRPNCSNIVSGIQAFSIGLFKKVIIADNMGKIVSFGYQNLDTISSIEAIMTILAYTLQIYNDFSGYCDMATGIALMFNIYIPQNFNSPYKAKTIVEFWKRWHMTLTRFLTRYVYIPLGGNRKGKIRQYLNIFIVFALSGIWHGAGYTFIIWGILHGTANIICRMTEKYNRRIPKWINWSITFLFINMTWIVFRAENMSQAYHLASRIFAGGTSIHAELIETMLQPTLISVLFQFMPFTIVIFLFIALVVLIDVKAKNTKEIIEKKNCSTISLMTTYMLFIISILSLSGVSSFLYFNF